MKFLKYLLFVAWGFAVWQCVSTADLRIEEPKWESNNIYRQRKAYSLVYNETNRLPDWVAYRLDRGRLEVRYKRKDNFVRDMSVQCVTASNADYKGQGFDRGHLAPAADMAWDEQALDESFYLTNICPQLPSFNRGVWKQLEERVRKWAERYDRLYIATGPVCENPDSTIGTNRVVVPTAFYKTILIYNDTIKQAVGFVFPHGKCTKNLFDYTISVDSVEIITGLDFYHNLSRRKQKQIESSVNTAFWQN